MKNVVQSLKKFQKDKAIDLRKQGLSYSDIQKRTKVPKSTLSLWLRGVELDESQKTRLENRRLETAKTNARKRMSRISEMIEEIKISSAQDIKEISKRELWLMGIILYWRERASSGNETDIWNGVRFTSSDPYLLKFFIKWLHEAGGIKDEEIKFDIFISEDKKASLESIKEVVRYWSKILEFPKENFLNHIYFQKKYSRKRTQPGQKKRKTNIPKNSQFGILRVRVRGSSMLARQIAGWIKGIRQYYWE